MIRMRDARYSRHIDTCRRILHFVVSWFSTEAGHLRTEPRDSPEPPSLTHVIGQGKQILMFLLRCPCWRTKFRVPILLRETVFLLHGIAVPMPSGDKGSLDVVLGLYSSRPRQKHCCGMHTSHAPASHHNSGPFRDVLSKPLTKYLRTLARRQDPSALLDSLVILTRRLEDVLLVTSRLTATAEPSLMLSMAPSSAVEGIWQASNNMDSLFVQASRAMENLLHMVEVWALGGHPELNQMRRNNRGADGTSDEGNFLAEIVFTSSERMLGCMCTMASRSESVAQGVAFISCTGAAMDSAATVLSCHEAPTSMMATSTSNGTSGGICNFPFLPMNWGPDPVPHHSNLPRCGSSKEQLVSEGSSRRGTKRTIAVRDLAIDDHNEHCSGTVAAASCLQSTLEMARASDLVAWLLNLYSQCGGGDNRLSSSAKEAGHREGQFRHDRSAEWPSGIAGAGHVAAPGMVAGCSFKTRELFVEVLETLLFAQGWINCLSSHDADRPLHSQRVSTNQIEVRHGSRDEIAQTNTESANLPGTLRLVLSSWAARREKELSLDHFVISLLGTDADNGYLCKLVVSAADSLPHP